MSVLGFRASFLGFRCQVQGHALRVYVLGFGFRV